MFQKAINYIKETRIEMRKVNWPTRQETMRFTATVIFVSLGIALLLGALDFLFRSTLIFFI